VQITLTLEATEAPWSVDLIDAAAAGLGFAAAGSGRWELREPTGELQLVLNAATLPAERLALSIDVPLVRPSSSPLSVQFQVAEQLASRLNGRVVDDNGRAVQRESHFAVAAQLATLYEEMQAAGITAGSERARRLYGA
jgi:hypothetical protein